MVGDHAAQRAMDAETEALIRRHDLSDQGFLHTDLQPRACACAARIVDKPPSSSGNACFVCGGITIQTGSCTTCTSCGTSGGCG